MSDRRTPTWADDSELHDEYGYGQQQGQAQGHQQGQQQQGQQQYADNGYPQQNQQYQQSGQQQQHQQQQQYGHGNQQQYAPTDEDQRRYAQQESLRQYAQQAQTRSRVQPTYPRTRSGPTRAAMSRRPAAGASTSTTGRPRTRTSRPTTRTRRTTRMPRTRRWSRRPLAEPVEPEPEKPGYTLPPVQESAWAVDTRRSKLLGRGVLLCVLLVQAGLVPAAERHGLPGRGALHRVRPLRTGEPPARHQAAGGLRGLLLRASQAVPGARGHRRQRSSASPAYACVSLLFMLGATALLYSTHPPAVQPACRRSARPRCSRSPVDDGARQLRHLTTPPPCSCSRCPPGRWCAPDRIARPGRRCSRRRRPHWPSA